MQEGTLGQLAEKPKRRILNEEKVREILLLLQEGRHPKDICKLYGTSVKTIFEIKYRNVWKRVTI